MLIAARWPADKLPPNGLHLAKRGNGVLPSGVAESNDPTKQWKTTLTSTPGTEQGLGMGVSSTAAMAGAEHPAAQYCRDMGEGWFLSSRYELELIYANKSTLGTSYSFDIGVYWIATEANSSNRWLMKTSSGTTGHYGYSKNLPWKVRCVRAI